MSSTPPQVFLSAILSPPLNAPLVHSPDYLQLRHPITKQYDSKDLTSPLESHCSTEYSHKPNPVYMLPKQVAGASALFYIFPGTTVLRLRGLCYCAENVTQLHPQQKGSALYLASLARLASKEAASCA